MFKIICVTDRGSCRGDFETQLANIAAAGPDGMILRDKGSSGADYTALFARVQALGQRAGVPVTAHGFAAAARDCGAKSLHLPLHLLTAMPDAEKAAFPVIGASCHSVPDAETAYRCGASYLIAGHIYATDCKKGLPGRGLPFLREICRAVPVPVYAIGGITRERIAAVRDAGAAGACIMSGLMASDDPTGFLRELREALHEFSA